MAYTTEIYVDPDVDSDSGAGSFADPYGDLAYALSDGAASGPTRINVKAGTSEVVTATLDFATNFSPAGDGSPVVVEGYTLVAGDGGRGVLDGTASNVQILSSANLSDFIVFKNIDFLGGDGSNPCIEFDTDCALFNCNITAYKSGIRGHQECMIFGCYIQYGNDAGGGYGYENTATSSTTSFAGNHVKALNAACDHAVKVHSDRVWFNVLDLRTVTSSGVNGIDLRAARSTAINNTILGGTGASSYGVTDVNSSAGISSVSLINNYIEGFTGSGSKPIHFPTEKCPVFVYNNKWYNCHTTFTEAFPWHIGEDNGVIAGSGLVDLAGGDFAPNAYLIGQAYPGSWLELAGNSNYLDVGAFQVDHTS